MDDILREVRAIREAYARRFNYDLDAIHRDLVEQQEQSRREGRVIVSPPPRRSPAPADETSQALLGLDEAADDWTPRVDPSRATVL